MHRLAGVTRVTLACLLVATVATIATVATVATGSGGSGGSGGEENWQTLARTALSQFAAADDGHETPHAYASAARASGLLDGWGTAETSRWLDDVADRELSQGGWGLGFPSDAFSDGTVNPADTLYTVTTAGHVGQVLLDGYDAGVVPGERVQRTVDVLLERVPLVPQEGPGLCLAYSEHDHDAGAGCVHNVNAQAGAFLDAAHDRGFSHPDLVHTVAGITARTAAAYDHEGRWWPYGEGSAMSYDAGHNHMASKVIAMLRLAPPIGADAAASLSAADFDEPRDVLGHVRMAARTANGCARAERLLRPFAELVENESDPRVQAQIAAAAAGIVARCG